MGQLHLMTCRHVDGVEIVSVVDQSKRAIRKAKSLQVKEVHQNYSDLISKAPGKLDAVIISLPNHLHFESIKLALEAGLHVFVEKPLATTTDECEKLAKLAVKSGKNLMVGHCLRFLDAVEKMKSRVDHGHIGSLEVLTAEDVINGPFAHGIVPSPPAEWWFDKARSGGGALIDIGSHLIDLFRFFAGDAKPIFCSLEHKYNLPVEDSAIVILQSLSSSTKGIINAGWYQQTVFPKFNFRLILHGDAGFLTTDHLIPRNLYLHAFKHGTKNFFRRITGRRINPLSYTYFYEPYFKEIKHFFDCIKYDQNPLVSAEDGFAAVRLVHEAYKLAGNRRTQGAYS